LISSIGQLLASSADAGANAQEPGTDTQQASASGRQPIYNQDGQPSYWATVPDDVLQNYGPLSEASSLPTPTGQPTPAGPTPDQADAMQASNQQAPQQDQLISPLTDQPPVSNPADGQGGPQPTDGSTAGAPQNGPSAPTQQAQDAPSPERADATPEPAASSAQMAPPAASQSNTGDLDRDRAQLQADLQENQRHQNEVRASMPPQNSDPVIPQGPPEAVRNAEDFQRRQSEYDRQYDTWRLNRLLEGDPRVPKVSPENPGRR
jgi:hypothetical protein